MYAILCRNNCQARNPNRRANRQGGRSCSGTTGGIWSANCAPPAPAPGPSCGCPSAWRDSPLARICWASPASCAPWAWSRPATTGALGLEPACYDRLLDFFHSPAQVLDKLSRAWCALVFRLGPVILRVNLKPVLVGDGIKVAKAGRKMPGVKKLHQESDSNTKPEYIFGPSCQAVAVLTRALSSVFALPLACRIHEGTVFSNRDHRTLLDKMILLLDSLDLKEPFYFVADAYYAS